MNTIDILFVCSGNLCRSPYAEAVARATFDGDRYTFSSAGTIAMTGKPCTTTMQEVAEARGFDVSSHGARALDDVPAPDLVFGMEQEHVIAASRAFPDLPAGSIRLLDHPRAIPDPYGHDRATYEAASTQIETALKALDL